MPDPNELDIHDTPEAEAERRRQQAAARARRYRAARKDQGKPDSNAVDQAISEAVSYLTSVVTNPKAIVIDVKEIHRVAMLCLYRDGYDKRYSRMAVGQRMKPRPAHDEISYIPSRQLTYTDAVIQPPREGPWTIQDLSFIRRVIKRWRDAVTPFR